MKFVRAFLLLAVTSLVAACAPSPPKTLAVPASTENLQKITGAYVQATARLGRPPAKLDELTPHLEAFGNASEILASPDDGQPYVILWGVDFQRAMAASPAAASPPVLAYEKLGKEGRRYVARLRDVTSLTDEEFRKANFPAGHVPAF